MKNTLMKKTLGMLMLSAVGLAATAAHADWNRGGYGLGHDRYAYQQSQAFSERVDARQDRQMMRIRAGVQEGRLSRAEFRDLMDEQHEIRAMEHHFRADGFIDSREFQRLDRALDVASRNIQAESRDRPPRYAYNSGPWSR